VNDRPIGVFDSGLGGLTVLREIHRLLPGESTIYLGDTARVPYGGRSAETVNRYAEECAGFLARQGIKLLVVACNTASALAVDRLVTRLPVPVVGVLDPGASRAAGLGKSTVGVIGTSATVESGAYGAAIRRFAGNRITVIERACPLFVPLAEEGWVEGTVPRTVAETYLGDLRGSVEAVVLGCTHYPVLKDVIGEVLGGVPLIDSGVETAGAVRETLEKRGWLRQGSAGEGARQYYVTDLPQKFETLARRFIGHPVERLDRVRLGAIEQPGEAGGGVRGETP